MEVEQKVPEATHILIVDDDEAIRNLIQRGIQPLGHCCSLASSGEAALEILENKKVDVVITDIVMPRFTGVELTQIVRKRYDIDVALEEISENREKFYDPDVVDACLKIFREKGFTFTGEDRL